MRKRKRIPTENEVLFSSDRERAPLIHTDDTVLFSGGKKKEKMPTVSHEQAVFASGKEEKFHAISTEQAVFASGKQEKFHAISTEQALISHDGDDRSLPSNGYHTKIDFLRLFLMLCVSINLYGVTGGAIGNFFEIAAGFAPMAFFLISGFLVLREDKRRSSRILRAMGRAFLTFVLLGAAYVGLNVLLYAMGGADLFAATPFTSVEFWKRTLLLNIWPYPIGKLLWYVQSLLYAYVILFILEKLNLLRFDWIWFLLLEGLSLASGEFVALLGWNPLGYNYLPEGFLTTALPCLLLGCFIHRKLQVLLRIDNLFYFLFALAGVGICFVEGLVVSHFSEVRTTQNWLGMLIIAMSLCMIAFRDVAVYQDHKKPYITSHLRQYTRWIYYLLEPVGTLIAFVASMISERWFSRATNWMWLGAFAASLAAAVVVGLIADGFKKCWQKIRK